MLLRYMKESLYADFSILVTCISLKKIGAIKLVKSKYQCADQRSKTA